MNNSQESAFYERQNRNIDPTPVPYVGSETRNVNADPREQRQAPPERAYREVYGDQDPYASSGQKIKEKVMPRRRHGGAWAILLLLLVVLLGLGLIFSTMKNQFGSLSSTQTRTFAVSGIPKLVIHDDSGTVHIQAGNTNTMIIQATKNAVGFRTNLDSVNVNYTQNGNEVDVSIDQPSNIFLGSESVNLAITLPVNTNMQVETGSGSVDATGINGQIDLQTGSGQIDVTDLHGQVVLHTGSGSMSLDGLNGQATLETGSGSITANRSVLSGDSLVKTGSGSINYDGSLVPQGSYRFETGSGSVDMTLPSSSAFHLHTSTGSGRVNNDFGTTTVGTGQQPELSISTGSGSINLHKGQ